LASSAVDIAVALERASAVWDGFRNHPSGQVSLVTFPTAGQMLLPSALQGLEHDGIRVDLTGRIAGDERDAVSRCHDGFDDAQVAEALEDTRAPAGG
ncbi:hypothetical protein ACC691_38205, partial [Rhizobium johnstonii]|uniref:hypothetical protein n=1 Tax=Rhizobium johnstonii TaxID=3019933 RepID=UPI003F9BC210